MNSNMRALLAGIALAAGAAQVSAATIVDTGASPNGFGWSLSGGEDFQWLAGRFTLAEATVLTRAEGYFTANEGSTFNVGIAENRAFFNDPGTILFSRQARAITGTTGWFGAGGLDRSLAAGDYWLVLRVLPEDDLRFAAVGSDVPRPLGRYAFQNARTGGGWAFFDPGASFGVRIEGRAAGAVPEPATWAMLIAGFGLVGASLRRRRAEHA